MSSYQNHISVHVILLLLAVNVFVQVGSQPVFPTWPNNYAGFSKDERFIAEGATFNYQGQPFDGVCCHNKSNCVVIMQYESGMTYVDRDNKRVRDDITDPSMYVVSFFDEKRQYLVIGDQCSSWCPLTGSVLENATYFVYPGATYIGRTLSPWDGQVHDTYFARSFVPIVNITMETETWWLDLSTTPATPQIASLDIEPLQQQQGNDTQYWSNMQWTQPDPKLFAFNGKETCPMDNNCGQSLSLMGRNQKHGLMRPRDVPPREMPLPAEKVQTSENTPIKDAHNSEQPKPPLLPTDWQGVICGEALQQHTAFKIPDGGLCCPHGHNCAVQYTYQCNMWYYDYSHNRTRLDTGDGTYTLEFYDQNTLYNVGSDGVCVSQCPIQNNDNIEAEFFAGGGLPLTYSGLQEFEGKVYQSWSWQETVFGEVLVSSVGYYDTSSTPYTPVAEIDDATFAGGVITTSRFHQIQWGQPDPNLFTCKGCDSTCEVADQCQDPGNAMKRQRSMRNMKFSRAFTK